MGRPTKITDAMIEQATKLFRLGAIDRDVAEFFHVTEKTLVNWRNEVPAFAEASRIGKIEADANVADSLYKRAMGYEHDDTDIRVVDGKIVQTKIRKFYPPDTAACIFWLKNRRDDLWRDRREFTGKDGADLSPPVAGAITFDDARRLAFILRVGTDAGKVAAGSKQEKTIEHDEEEENG